MRHRDDHPDDDPRRFDDAPVDPFPADPPPAGTVGDPLTPGEAAHPAAAHTGADASAETTEAHSRGGYQELDKIKHSLSARMWTGMIVGALVLIVLLVFVIQNPDSTDFQIFAWHFTMPLGVAILLAAIAGALITAVVGAVRMFQLRRAAKRAHR